MLARRGGSVDLAWGLILDWSVWPLPYGRGSVRKVARLEPVPFCGVLRAGRLVWIRYENLLRHCAFSCLRFRATARYYAG